MFDFDALEEVAPVDVFDPSEREVVPARPEEKAEASKLSKSKSSSWFSDGVAPGNVSGGVVDRSRLACARFSCKYLVHPSAEFGGYCCIACSDDNKHGCRCLCKVAPAGTPRADPSWRPPGQKYINTSITSEQLRKHDRFFVAPSGADKRYFHEWNAKHGCPVTGFYVEFKPESMESLRCVASAQRQGPAWSLEHNPNFFAELAAAGFFPMGDECYVYNNLVQILRICWDPEVSMLDLDATHVSRQVMKRAGHYTMTVDTAFDDVLLGCVRQHGEAWLFRGMRYILRTLHKKGYTGARNLNFGVHSFELWASDGHLVAGDLGYTLGAVYASMTGFREEHSKCAGDVQLVLMAALLHKMGYHWIDFGQVLKYKERLGARVVCRDEYLERLCQDRDLNVFFGHQQVGGRELLNYLLQVILDKHRQINCASCDDVQMPSSNHGRDTIESASDGIASKYGQVDWLLGLTREADAGYDSAWYDTWIQMAMISIETFLVHSDSWRLMPKLTRYREIPKKERYRVALSFGRSMGLSLTELGKPAVICVEKPWLDGFVDGVAQTIQIPLVLLAVNGGDEPLTKEVQGSIATLPGLRACFGNNMHQPRDDRLFQPMPIGIMPTGVLSESSLCKIAQTALPWEQRDRRLLVAPMRDTNRLRKQYREVLSRREYTTMVHIVNERLALEEFLKLLSQHQCVLSPPGRGYDCARTWQAIAVGTVPAVVNDDKFDQRLHTGTGPEYIPFPDELSPEFLEHWLSRLSNPARYQEVAGIQYWKTLWNSFF